MSLNLAVISYRRSSIGTAYIKDWKDEDTNLAVRDLPELRRRIEKKTVKNIKPITKKDFENPNQLFENACKEISDDCKPDRVCLTGFGPFLTLIERDKQYGVLTNTADEPFRNQPIASWVKNHFFGKERQPDGIFFRLVTDVSSLAAYNYWKTVSDENLIYHSPQNPHVVTAFIIGSGIGGASVQKFGQIIGQHSHTEMGHAPVSRHPNDRLSTYHCAHHKEYECFTGLANSFALKSRANLYKGETIDSLYHQSDHEIWDIQAYYLAQLCLNAIYTVAPTSIVFTGPLLQYLKEPNVFLQKVRDTFDNLQNEFVRYAALEKNDFLGLVERDTGMLLGGMCVLLSDDFASASRARYGN